MSTVAERQDALVAEQRRFEHAHVDAPDWLRDLRRRALTVLEQRGLPTTRDESWRFTPSGPLSDPDLQLAEGVPAEAPELLDRVTIPDAHRLVLLNGRFSPELSSAGELPRGLRLTSLAEAIAGNEAACTHLGLQPFDEHPFAALNTAFLRDGAVILVAAGAVIDTPIHLVMITGDRQKVMAHPRSLVMVGAGAQATIAQTFLGAPATASVTNAVTEVSLGDGAIVDFCVDQRLDDAGSMAAALFVRVGRDSSFRCRTVTLGGQLVRNDVAVVLDGEGGHATLDGIYIVDGERLVDNHTTIDHATPHCTSHELYKGILDGKARAVFNGRIIVRQDAQKTDAKQTNRALLLSDEAQINANPQLEIFADDVKCTHGAAVGQLDEDALFYLQARGLTRQDARDLLIHAYAGEVLAGIPIPPLRAQIERELFVQLERDLAAHGDQT